MILWMKYQLHKHKDMSLDSYHPPKSYALAEGIGGHGAQGYPQTLPVNQSIYNSKFPI